MSQEIGQVLAYQAMTRVATSALPCAPVLSEPRRRRGITRRLLGALTERGRTRA